MKEIEHQGKYKADFAVSNYGGMRVPSITPGPLTVGEIFELASFDNAIVIVETPGNLVDSLFQLIAGRGGWPMSKGLRIVIQDNKVKSMTLHGAAIERNKTYRIAMPDYVANGGDDAGFLVPLARENTGLVLRDALIAVAKRTGAEGHAITSTLEGRIIKM
jgi:2',3'-cyclic-nucleotide 2'-phosphodiesterase (5'-nucleotidase family)